MLESCGKLEVEEMVKYGVRIEGGMALVPNTWVDGCGGIPVATIALTVQEACRIFKGLPDQLEFLESKTSKV